MPKRRKADPRQRPEGTLLWRAQELRKLTDAEAAAMVNTKPATWGNWVKGYRSTGAGEWAPVVIDAIPLAVAAHALGITPEQLRQAGRTDAAAELTNLQEAVPRLRSAATPLRRLVAIRDEIDAVIAELRSGSQETGG